MKRPIVLLCAAVAIVACNTATPVMKVDDLYAEREKSKAEFHKKYAGKEIVVAGTFTGSMPTFDYKNNTQGTEDIPIFGTSYHLVRCIIEEKDSASFKGLAGKGEGLAVKGKIVSAENDAVVELRPCTMDLKK